MEKFEILHIQEMDENYDNFLRWYNIVKKNCEKKALTNQYMLRNLFSSYYYGILETLHENTSKEKQIRRHLSEIGFDSGKKRITGDLIKLSHDSFIFSEERTHSNIYRLSPDAQKTLDCIEANMEKYRKNGTMIIRDVS